MKLILDERRKKRYKEKFSHTRERLLDLEEWLSFTDEKSILASEKAFQEAVEAITDIFAMLLADMKLEMGDDYMNIEKIGKRGIISQEQEKTCIEANGLRNVVVHKYIDNSGNCITFSPELSICPILKQHGKINRIVHNGIEEEKFIESAKELAPLLNEIIRKIEEFIENA